MQCELHTAVTLCEQPVKIQTISLHKQSAEPEKGYYQHRHPGFEIHYVFVGSCRVNCESKSYRMDAGTILIIPPGAYHDLVDDDRETLRLSISFDLNALKVAKGERKGAVFAHTFYRGCPFFADLQNTQAQQTLLNIEDILSSPLEGLYTKDKLLALCSILLLELAEFMTTDKSDPQSYDTTGDLPDATFRIDEFLARNFMCNNAMSRMAEELHISTRQLHRMIRKNYQTNYRKKLSETRIKIAMDMLQNSTMPIHCIGEILGYRNSSNFSIFIKRCTGKTPSQIRSESNQEQE